MLPLLLAASKLPKKITSQASIIENTVYASVKPKYLLLPDVKEDEAPVYFE